jgi:hypothetical protein
MRSAALLVLLLAGCVHVPAERCPGCVVVDARHPAIPRLKPGAERLFVIVPGVLGYGWEWDDAVKALAQAPHADYVIFWWEPWGSVEKGARELADTLLRALWTTPAQVREVVVAAHSVGGIVAAHALGRIQVPAGKQLTVLTIGVPFGGMLGPPFSIDDALRSPAMMSVMGTFRDYPDPPPRTRVIEYVTSFPSDPVMQPRYGHQVSPPGIGPRGARRVAVDPKFDHNRIVSRIVLSYLQDGRAPLELRP